LQLSSQLRLAPLFELPRIGKGKVRLQDLQGQVVIIHFWASWCPPCLDEIPQWVELGTYFKGKRLRLVAISEDQTESEALAVLPTQRLPDNIFSLLDRQGQTSERYGTFQYPETYLLTPRLEIAMKWVGPQDWSSEVIRKQIESLLP
jgi:thiol-disulfide isomerase/thioredoxin